MDSYFVDCHFVNRFSLFFGNMLHFANWTGCRFAVAAMSVIVAVEEKIVVNSSPIELIGLIVAATLEQSVKSRMPYTTDPLWGYPEDTAMCPDYPLNITQNNRVSE